MLPNVWNSNRLSSNVSLYSIHEATTECSESGSSGYFHPISNAPTTTSKPNKANLLTTESKEPHYMFPFRIHFKETLPITLAQAVRFGLRFGMYPFWISIGTLFWARFSWFFSVVLGECHDKTSTFGGPPPSTPFTIHYSNHLTIQRYTFWATKSVVKWIICRHVASRGDP